jgi:hypothetical protein
MKIERQVLVYDTADLDAESTFWSSLIGGTVDADDDWHTVSVDGEAKLAFQLAPDHIQPEWPDGSPQQAHLDLFVADPKAAHEEVTTLGARLLMAADDIEAASGCQVYADPSGHPFCICWG